MARPKLDIDTDQVRRLASLGVPQKDIAYVMKCSVDTLQRRCADEMAEGAANLRVKLRTKQLEVAFAGNVAMLIWLGKQLLGQVDKQEVKHDTADDNTIRINWGSISQHEAT